MMVHQETIGEVQPWPSSLEFRAVLRHKSVLIQQADYLSARVDAHETLALQRTLYRGAAAWEYWLLSQDNAWNDDAERRALSALSLADLAGDLRLTALVLETCRKKGCPTHKYIYRTAKQRAESLTLQWNRPAEKLGRLYERFAQTRSPSARDELRAFGQQLLLNQGHPREVHYLLGRAAVIAEQFEEAEAHFFHLCVTEPFYPAAGAFWADSLAKRDVRLAAEIMRRAAVCNGSSPTHLAFQLRFEWDLWKQSDHSEPPPVEFAERALHSVIGSPDISLGAVALTHLVSAYILEAAERIDDALDVIDAGLRRRPRDTGLRVMRGLLLLSAGRVEAALGEFLIAEPQTADNRLVEALLGSTLLGKGDASGAIPHLQRSIELTSIPAELGALYNDLGVAFARVGRTNDAERCFRRSIELLGDDLRPRRNLELLIKGNQAPEFHADNLVLLFQRDLARKELESRASELAFAEAA